MRDEAAQVQRLVGLYAGMGDDQLLQMAQGADDLTDVAREALAQVMRERDLSVAVQEAEPDEPEAVQVDPGQLAESERWLWTFGDAFQAGEAIRLLDEAGIWHRVTEKSASGSSEADSRTLLGLIVIVDASDYAAAQVLLREKMGLFPLAEVEGAAQSHLTGMEGTVLLAMFDRQEALVVADALGRAGISFWWRDGRQEVDELPDTETVAIEVNGATVDEAQAVVEKRLAELG